MTLATQHDQRTWRIILTGGSFILSLICVTAMHPLPSSVLDGSPAARPALQTSATPMPPRLPPSGSPPIDSTAENPLTDRLRGQVQVIITLNDPPAAALLASLGVGASPAFADFVRRMETALVLGQQAGMVKALSAPPINAVILSQTGAVLNSIAVQVDATALPLIQGLPGVKGISVVTVAYPDPVTPEGVPPQRGAPDVVAPQGGTGTDGVGSQ